MVSTVFFVFAAATHAFDGALCATPPALDVALSAAKSFWQGVVGQAEKAGPITLTKPVTQHAKDAEGATLTMTFEKVERMKWSKWTSQGEFCAEWTSVANAIHCTIKTMGVGNGKYTVEAAQPKKTLDPAENAKKPDINAVDVEFTRHDTKPGHLLKYYIELTSPEPKVSCKCSEARWSGPNAPVPLHATDTLKDTSEKLSIELLCLAFCDADSVEEKLKRAIKATYK